MKRVILIPVLIILLANVTCRRVRPGVSPGMPGPDIVIRRFEMDLFEIPPGEMEAKLPALQEKYGHFLDLFGYVINIGESTDPGFARYLELFVRDSINREVYDSCLFVFNDLTWLEDQLSGAFRNYQHYFPGRKIPVICTYMSRFNHSLVMDEGILAIGIDKYLGDGVSYYQRLGIPLYMRTNMYPGKIISDCMYYWASTEYPYESGNGNVLSHILYQGKLLYFTRSMLPREPEERIIGYTKEQLNWCKRYEGSMYDYLVEERLMFEKNPLTINKLVNEAPFTTYFSRESPGRVGAWLGWQIITAYMDRNPGVSLPDLMADMDYQAILESARYRP